MPIKSKIALFVLALSFLWAVPLFASTGNASLYPLFKNKTVKIHVSEVKDSTKGHEADPKIVRQKIEEALTKRKSVKFEVVTDPSQADLVVNTDVSEFFWTDHDPVDMMMGAATTAYDIAVVEDYARLQADMTVVDNKSKKELWKEHVMATVTKMKMPLPDSVPEVSEHLAKIFIKDCFSKKHS
jgi:hypothetical protein